MGAEFVLHQNDDVGQDDPSGGQPGAGGQPEGLLRLDGGVLAVPVQQELERGPLVVREAGLVLKEVVLQVTVHPGKPSRDSLT